MARKPAWAQASYLASFWKELSSMTLVMDSPSEACLSTETRVMDGDQRGPENGDFNGEG